MRETGQMNNAAQTDKQRNAQAKEESHIDNNMSGEMREQDMPREHNIPIQEKEHCMKMQHVYSMEYIKYG